MQMIFNDEEDNKKLQSSVTARGRATSFKQEAALRLDRLFTSQAPV